MAGKMQVLYNQSFTKRRQYPVVYDQAYNMIEKERNQEFRQKNMLRVVLLVISNKQEFLY
jgi:hypothetical protein